MPLKRRIEKIIKDDLSKKMVLIAGPRQCGKTTFAEGVLEEVEGAYYNWDYEPHRKMIRSQDLDYEAKLWVFDELHKYRHWRNWLKGLYDINKKKHKFLVTGSAKLDMYSRGGDSLQGRYFFHRLHPFTYSELLNVKISSNVEEFPFGDIYKDKDGQKSLLELFKRGGFPEPLFSKSLEQADRWRLNYGYRVIREDIRTLESVKDLDKMELLYDHLPNNVGSLLSINSLREDLEVNHGTVSHWLEILEKNYICFRVPPFGPLKIRAVKKENKLYFWDWAKVENEPARFENLIAVHLLRLCHWGQDVNGKKIELRHYRDTRGHEVDFVVLKQGVPWIAVEVKLTEGDLDSKSPLKYLLERVSFKHAYQVHLHGNKFKEYEKLNGCNITIMPAYKFLSLIP